MDNIIKEQRNKKIALSFIVIFITLYYIWIMSFEQPSDYLAKGSYIFQLLASIIAGCWLWSRFLKTKNKFRFFWFFSSLAVFSHALAVVISGYQLSVLDRVMPYIGLPDILWLLSILLYYVAFFYVLVSHNEGSKLVQSLFDILIVMIVMTAMSWQFIIAPLIDFSLVYGWAYTIIQISYTIGKLGLLLAVLSLYYSSIKSIPKRVHQFNVLGLALLLLTNAFYIYLVMQDKYYFGNLTSPLWALAVLILGFASFCGRDEESEEVDNDPGQERNSIFSTRLLLPYLCVIILIGYIFFKYLFVMNSIVIGAILTILLIICRQIFAIIKNRSLLLQTQELNRELENKVKQRTEELLENNQKLQETIKKVEHLAYHDALTNLPNRRGFEERAISAMESCQISDDEIAIMFLDLDRFRIINDSLGHNVGDDLLEEVADMLRKYIGKNSFLSRQGGDEFLLLLQHESKESALKIANQILSRFQMPFKVRGNELFISCSLGVTMYPEHGQDIDLLIQRAETAMYMAKRKGRNCYLLFHEEMEIQVTQKMMLENDLRKAIEKEELYIYYQPKLDVATHQIIGMEALLRWKHAELGFISPSQFIPIAEEAGFIVSIGNWVLRQSCRQLKHWHAQGYAELSVSINVSTMQFLQKNFVRKVKEILDETLVNVDKVELEITESVMHNTEEVISTLNQLQEIGVKISVDDFGSGYSSLGHLKKLPLNILKIDKSFIQDIHGQSNDLAIVSTIISLGKNLGLKVIAEGVENEKQYQLLKEKGCDQIQGYYLSKPLPVAELEREILQKYFDERRYCPPSIF